MIQKICNFISGNMAIIVLLVAAITLLLPQSMNWINTKWISLWLGLVMFGMGLTLDPNDFKIVFSRPKDIIIGSLAQFSIMPMIAFLLGKLFNLSDELALGVVLVGCCPGGTASNVMTYLAKGDLALSVGMTMVSTILAPFLTPLLTLLYAGERVNVDPVSMFVSILSVVILPIIIGFVISHYFPNFTKRISSYLPAFSSLMIIFIVGVLVAHNSQKLLVGGAIIVAVVIIHNICGLSLGYGVGKLMKFDHSKRSAISIEVGMQNSGLASSLANIHFAAYPLATIPGAIFSVWHNISGAIVAKIYSKSSK